MVNLQLQQCKCCVHRLEYGKRWITGQWNWVTFSLKPLRYIRCTQFSSLNFYWALTLPSPVLDSMGAETNRTYSLISGAPILYSLVKVYCVYESLGSILKIHIILLPPETTTPLNFYLFSSLHFSPALLLCFLLSMQVLIPSLVLSMPRTVSTSRCFPFLSPPHPPARYVICIENNLHLVY